MLGRLPLGARARAPKANAKDLTTEGKGRPPPTVQGRCHEMLSQSRSSSEGEALRCKLPCASEALSGTREKQNPSQTLSSQF